MLIAGFGNKGRSKGDIPGVRFKVYIFKFKVIKVSGVSLMSIYRGKKIKPRR